MSVQIWAINVEQRDGVAMRTRMATGFALLDSPGSLQGVGKTPPMAKPEAKTPIDRRLLANMRVTAAERAHLQRVAAERSTTISDVMRQALRRDGALPNR